MCACFTGAPVHRQMPVDYNPMFPMMAPNGQDGSVDYQQLQSQQQQHQGEGDEENGTPTDDRTPPANLNGSTTSPPPTAPSTEPSYFPPVFPSSSSSNSTPSSSSASSPAISAPSSLSGKISSAPLSPTLSSSSHRPEMPQHAHSADAATTGALNKNLAALKLDAASSAGAGWGGDFGQLGGAGGEGAAQAQRRRSFVPGAAGLEDRATSIDIRRRFEGEDGALGGGGVGAVGSESLVARRASLEEGSRSRPKFGTSIWGL